MNHSSDIPSGLNRIKTRRDHPDPSSSGGDDSPAVSSGRAGVRGSCSKGFRKGKKIARWITAFSSKTINKAPENLHSNTEVDEKNSELNLADKNEIQESAEYCVDFTKNHSVSESICVKQTAKGQKSFSHELGPRGGIRPVQPRARSYNDFEELLRSLNSKFDTAKEEVNAELAFFAGDLMDVLEIETFSHALAEDLLILAQKCVEMPANEFRTKCEGIVQDLAEKRQNCQPGLLKQLFTRMLFIVTRCTRLVQLDKCGATLNKDSMYKFKQCLDSIPAVQTNWVQNQRNAGFRLDATWKQKWATLEENSSKIYSPPEDSLVINSPIENPARIREPKASHSGNTLLPHDIFSRLPKKCQKEPKLVQLKELEESQEVSDAVLCRICEENVPTFHLESHSYICAYADKGDLEGFDVDESLLNVANILEEIMESYTQYFQTSYSETLRMQNANLTVGSDNQLPKVFEWHTKGTQGMFEDLHEMDTACIDESHVASFINLKAYLAPKLGDSAVTSSNGSMTPASSVTSPRVSHFDLFWLECNNASEQEDVEQMKELASIAHSVADTDVADENAAEILSKYMNELLDILQRSKLKALIVDTFGSRIRNLLKEKYLLAIELMEDKNATKIRFEEERQYSFNTSSISSPTPAYALHKERTSIDDFEIIKPISRGAFGKVFLARKRTTGDLFAIKVLKKLDMIRKNDIERILSERNILITVRNPFVVRFFYSFTCSDNLYLVMEYLNGGDLYSLLRKVGCLDEEVARVYVAELVLALEYIHSQGIVHRDLKPDNILVARDGHIKLTDFGLSKIGLINNAADLSGLVAQSSFILGTQNLHASPKHAQENKKRSRQSAVGTPDYLAPEILLGTEHGFAADWWSVGIILFEFITGVPPFTAHLPEMIFDKILNRRIPWPRVPEEMTCEAKDLIDRLLIQDPHLRLGVKGASEVKAHPFFDKIDWGNLASLKAAFVPNPDSADDTSYFMSRYTPGSVQVPEYYSSDFNSDATDSSLDASLETHVDDCGGLGELNPPPAIDLSSINFSFKNLSQLASINYDVLIQSGKASNGSSPARGPLS